MRTIRLPSPSWSLSAKHTTKFHFYLRFRVVHCSLAIIAFFSTMLRGSRALATAKHSQCDDNNEINATKNKRVHRRRRRIPLKQQLKWCTRQSTVHKMRQVPLIRVVAREVRKSFDNNMLRFVGLQLMSAIVVLVDVAVAETQMEYRRWRAPQTTIKMHLIV